MAESNLGCGVVVLGALALWYCSNRGSETPRATAYSDSAAEAAMSSVGDEPDAEEEGDETRYEYESRQEEIGGSLGTYHGDVCTVDCGGHDAGREWAEAQGITDPSQCGGKSWSFQEGCESYAREREAEEERESAEADADY